MTIFLIAMQYWTYHL